MIDATDRAGLVIFDRDGVLVDRARRDHRPIRWQISRALCEEGNACVIAPLRFFRRSLAYVEQHAGSNKLASRLEETAANPL
jgi:phosphoglycolate phosphatase-like HAD superfamily hydrolase